MHFHFNIQFLLLILLFSISLHILKEQELCSKWGRVGTENSIFYFARTVVESMYWLRALRAQVAERDSKVQMLRDNTKKKKKQTIEWERSFWPREITENPSILVRSPTRYLIMFYVNFLFIIIILSKNLFFVDKINHNKLYIPLRQCRLLHNCNYLKPLTCFVSFKCKWA